MVKASLAGLAGLSVPQLLQARAGATEATTNLSAKTGAAPSGTGVANQVAPAAARSPKSVILLWMAGGPSHIDTWDPKPERPYENHGPFGTIATKLPGVRVCEYLPKQAALLDRFTLIRSVDARNSNHEPNKVFQTANLEAEPRVNPKAEQYPAIASIVAKHHGANNPLLPLFDHLITTLVLDLERQGLLDQTLVIAMGEFGRTPQIGTQDSTDGRNHWPDVMSMCLAGGGLRHGQVIGATETDGGHIRERPVTPGDLAATIYHYMGVPLSTTYEDERGRPTPIITQGAPIRELL